MTHPASPQSRVAAHLPPNEPGPHSKRLGMIAVVATFGGLLFGYDTGVVNGALKPMKEDLGLTPFTEGFVVSALVIGAAFGALIGGRLSDRFGRRHNILMLAGVFAFGTLGCVFSPTWEVLGAFRFILGIAVGGASVTVPVYLAEVAPFEKRGSLVTRNEVMIVSGQFAAFVINAIIFNVWGEHSAVWRFMLLIAVLPAFALFIGMLRMPESPRWLSSQGRDDDALAVLHQVRSPRRAEAEMAEVHQLAEEEEKAQTGGWTDLAVPWIRRLVFIGIGLGIVQQVTGINSIMYYGTQLLETPDSPPTDHRRQHTQRPVQRPRHHSGHHAHQPRQPAHHAPRRIRLITTFHILIGLSALLLPDGSVIKPYLILVFVVCFVFSMQGTLGPLACSCSRKSFP